MRDRHVPFSYAGNKLSVVDTVWKLVGADVGGFFEPFAGSACVSIWRPERFTGYLFVNDKDGYVVNALRFLRDCPEDWVRFRRLHPSATVDLNAFARFIYGHDGQQLVKELNNDPEYCDPLVACRWLYVACNRLFFNNEFEAMSRYNNTVANNRNGPYKKELTTEQKQLEDVTMIANRLRDALISCQDWQKSVSPVRTGSVTTVGVFFDPPYQSNPDRLRVRDDYGITPEDSLQLNEDVAKWCLQHGNDPKYRVVLAGYDNHYDLEKEGWTLITWSDDVRAQYNTNKWALKEKLWASPYCHDLNRSTQEGLF